MSWPPQTTGGKRNTERDLNTKALSLSFPNLVTFKIPKKKFYWGQVHIYKAHEETKPPENQKM